MEAEKSKKTSSMYYTAMDVQEMLGISKGMAYKILRKLNAELAAKNYIVIPGKIPRAYFCRALLWNVKLSCTMLALK